MIRQNWRLYSGMVSREECERITKLCYDTCRLDDGTVFNGADTTTSSELRQTKVGWIEDQGLMSMAVQFLRLANRDAFGFDIDYMPPLQFGEYNEGSFYDYHYDVNWEGNTPYDRKLSYVLQLSDPSTYEGGVFEFKEIEQPTRFSEQGSILIFPSYLTHRVTKVTKGRRNSLVGWIEGPRWK